MIKTGDWTIPDLVKYLVSVRSALQTIEIEGLRLTPAFPEEGTAEQFREERSEDSSLIISKPISEVPLGETPYSRRMCLKR